MDLGDGREILVAEEIEEDGGAGGDGHGGGGGQDYSLRSQRRRHGNKF